MTNIKTTINRRHFVAGTTAVAALAFAGRPARAQGGRVVVGTWGGDYARLLTKNIEQPFLAEWEVVQDQAGDPERRAKMLAERRLPRGTTDVQALQDMSMFMVAQQGLTQPIEFDRLPNAQHILPSMKIDYGIQGIYSGMVVLHNPGLVDAVPASYADGLSPSLGNKVGLIDIQYRHNIAAAALAAAGSVTAVEEGQKLLMELRAAGARIYPTNEAFAQGLQTQEIAVGIMWKARALQWQEAGINVQTATPSEGFLPYTSGFVIPKNAQNVDGAYAYLNAVLEPASQLSFAQDMGYNPTIDNVEVPQDLAARIGFTQDEVDKMNPMDFAFFMENDRDLKGWWDQEFKA